MDFKCFLKKRDERSVENKARSGMIMRIFEKVHQIIMRDKIAQGKKEMKTRKVPGSDGVREVWRNACGNWLVGSFKACFNARPIPIDCRLAFYTYKCLTKPISITG